jgi:hypothetical protein
MSTAFQTPALATPEAVVAAAHPGQTGPRTPEGKAISSQNAVKYGIFSQIPYRNEAEKAQWELHRAGYFDRYNPVGIPEIDLVGAIAHDNFRLIRMRAIEDDIFCRTPESDAPDHDCNENGQALSRPTDSEDESLVVSWQAHHKELNNLALYMQRTHRLIERETKALKELQDERRVAHRNAFEDAKILAACTWDEERFYDHATDGDPAQPFVFSNNELAYAVTRDLRMNEAPKTAKPAFITAKNTKKAA